MGDLSKIIRSCNSGMAEDEKEIFLIGFLCKTFNDGIRNGEIQKAILLANLLKIKVTLANGLELQEKKQLIRSNLRAKQVRFSVNFSKTLRMDGGANLLENSTFCVT